MREYRECRNSLYGPVLSLRITTFTIFTVIRGASARHSCPVIVQFFVATDLMVESSASAMPINNMPSSSDRPGCSPSWIPG
jgi:hypothetical protein